MGQVHRIWLLRGLLRATGKSPSRWSEANALNTSRPGRWPTALWGRGRGNLFVWRATLVRELRSPRRVGTRAVDVVGATAARGGARYRYQDGRGTTGTAAWL